MTWRLGRTVQCAKCPWKKTTDPNSIPNGYSKEKHKNLRNTIAIPGELNLGQTLKVMACHEEHQEFCIGWLHNQLGAGNNIALRLQMRTCENGNDIQIIGPQHPTFEDTLKQ